MKAEELRAKSKEELKELVTTLKKEQFNLRFQSATGELANRGRFKDVRKTIARVMTLLNEEPGKASPKAKPAAAKKAPAKKTKKG